MIKAFVRQGIVGFYLLVQAATALAADIKGVVIDKQSGEPLIGAAVLVDGQGAATDIDGRFQISGLKKGTYTVTIQYVAYKTATLQATAADEPEELTIQLEADQQTLGEVKVTGVRRHNTQMAMIAQAKESRLVVNNISAQEIKKTQDNNAGEVIKRIPGVSLIEDKFVMVRGLSQRYNNVWINGGAVPSSEADSRAFSFDIIPSSQIDHLVIVKSPSPEYPADFSGGFIQIYTKDIPTENRWGISVGGNWNDATAFQDFSYAKGGSTDFLGFDRSFRPFSGGFDAALKTLNTPSAIDLQGNGFNNDWRVKQRKPFGDLKLGADWSHRWDLDGAQVGLVGALNYTNETRAYTDMINNLFGVYDQANDRSNYLRHSVDNQYNNNVRLGAMLNLALLTSRGNDRIELKNIVNQLSTDRYTDRTGVNA